MQVDELFGRGDSYDDAAKECMKLLRKAYSFTPAADAHVKKAITMAAQRRRKGQPTQPVPQPEPQPEPENDDDDGEEEDEEEEEEVKEVKPKAGKGSKKAAPGDDDLE